MDVQTKKVELIQWILNSNEDILLKVEKIKEKTTQENIDIYSTKGESFTKSSYKEHINTIRESIKKGAKTYSTDEVRDFVLNQKN
jgi:peptidoglycan hydrolase-like amidase